jgi:hypothetical protein
MKRFLFNFLLCLLLWDPIISNCQIIKTKLDIVGGISAREYVHGGIRYQYSDITQLGLYYGGDIGIYPEIINTYCIDNMIHFGKQPYHSNRPAWYARQGFTYSVSKAVDFKRIFSYIDLSAGREFCVNDWLGFNFDLGLLVQLSEKKIWKDPSHGNENIQILQWLPLFRLQAFISL